SDVLGLGDVIFPSILVRWTKYFDEKATRAQEEATDASEGVLEHQNQRYNMYQAAIGGYIIGLVMCEIFQTGSGAPALLFLVPSMFISLGIQILRSKIPISELINQQQ
ncbi:MAG: hypothetical protein K2Z81_24380, partial [Cyanobacteria bacterium]|nr:hypothetical protein [Cyanobacteriota bacterium]